jgi:3,4-dihydroxy 2-butanone 4-phosphate synthase/GTP cyclohydrolase II
VHPTHVTPFASIDEAVDDLRHGRMVVVCDDEDRENEGDLVMAAERVTPSAVNFMIREGRGLVCLALTPGRCDELGLAPMASENTSRFETAFTVTIDARHGVTTGVSPAERAHTIKVAIDARAGAGDLTRGGHVLPIRARPGGVLERPGHTEASTDLARLAGLVPAGVICEIVNDDGSMARGDDLVRFCARHGLKMITIAELVAHRQRSERLVERVVDTRLPTAFGEFTLVGYRSLVDDAEHVAIVKGEVAGRPDVLVRMHSRCLIGDAFHSLRCDCGGLLQSALAMLEREGSGVVTYLSPPALGTCPMSALTSPGPLSCRGEARDGTAQDVPGGYALAAQILGDLDVRSVRLLTTDALEIRGLEHYGLPVTADIPLGSVAHDRCRRLDDARR